MSEINIQVVPGQQIEVGGKRYEAVAFRCPTDNDIWLTQMGDTVRRSLFPELRLILRQLPTRKVPTDKDAAVWPRRKCWVRSRSDVEWKPGTLLYVEDGDDEPFGVLNQYGVRVRYKFCEIEVKE